ncbi:MAG: sporulation integral membrane protein YtvI [Lachnospiraceae bacterium]|nr:sporulation integral membrane protein YtvI [Lachnospiraceae bacterium]
MKENKESSKKKKREVLREAREKMRIHAEYSEPIRPVLEEPVNHTESLNKEDRLVYIRVVVNLALALVSLILIIWLLPKVLVFFMPFVIAYIIAAIANPLVSVLKKKMKIARKISSAVVIVLVILAILAALYGIGYVLVTEGIKLYDNRESILATIQSAWTAAGEKLSAVYDILPASVQVGITDFSQKFPETISNMFKGMDISSVTSAFGVFGNFVDVLLGVIACVLAAYFFTTQHDDILEGLRKITPKATVEYYRLVTSNFKKAIGGYFKAQFIIMMIVFAIQFVAFIILKIPYSALVSVLIAVLDFLPVFGMGAVYWPWIAVDLFTGNYGQAIALSVLYIVLQLVRQLLQPKLVSDAVEMNPLLTLFCMYIGYRVAGVGGLIIAIPIGMIIVSLYRIGAFDRIIKGIRILGGGINRFRKY